MKHEGATPVRRFEARHPCPVCIGVKLARKPIGDEGLVLDHCDRCGGIWFELGEVQALRRVRPHALWARVERRTEPRRMQCHACHAPMPRHDPECGVCGWRNRIDCPVCDRPMDHHVHADIRLDACKWCKGVWFDHDELAGIWNESFQQALERRPDGSPPAGENRFFIAEALAWDPFITFYAADAAAHALGAGAEVLAHAPGALAGEAEAAGEVAGGLFETIVEIIGGLFG